MLTASIVVHKTPAGQLQKAINCLLSSHVDKIYIIDNSPGESLSAIALFSPKIDYRHVENNGFGAGHNIALREVIEPASDADNAKHNEGPCGFHLVMNADVCWEGNVLTPLLNFLQENPDVGMVMPKTFYPDGDLQYTCRMLPTPFDLFAKRFLPASFTKKRMERYLLAPHNHDIAINCPYLLGSFLLFRNDALRQCGVFDERFFMYPEDIDITRRIHEHWRTMYWPGVSIIHEHAAASRKSFRMLRIHLVNMIKYFNKWGWLCDKKRRLYNKRLLNSISYIPPSSRPSARG